MGTVKGGGQGPMGRLALHEYQSGFEHSVVCGQGMQLALFSSVLPSHLNPTSFTCTHKSTPDKTKSLYQPQPIFSLNI